jgi:hypothetical protein
MCGRNSVNKERVMERREFLVSTAAAVAGLAASRSAWGQAAPQWSKVKQSTLDRISIMTLNFQRILKVPDVQDSPDRTLELFDVAQMVADTYGVHKVEFQHYHIPSTEPAYLKELRARIEKSKSRMTQINLEFSELNISAPRQRDRLMAIDLTKMWIDHAAMLGAQRVMINQGGPSGQGGPTIMPTPENKGYSIPALKAMVDYGRSKDIIVSVETRGAGGGRGGRGAGPAAGPGQAPAPGPGQSPASPTNVTAGVVTTPAAPGAAPAAAPPPGPPPLTGLAAWTLLAEILKESGARSNVDVGGAGAASQEELHTCLKMLFPMTAGSMHTRVNTRWDLATAIKFLENDLGYKGLYTIEASNGHEGTKEIYDVVVATL